MRNHCVSYHDLRKNRIRNNQAFSKRGKHSGLKLYTIVHILKAEVDVDKASQFTHCVVLHLLFIST